jgi:hypothetical protein
MISFFRKSVLLILFFSTTTASWSQDAGLNMKGKDPDSEPYGTIRGKIFDSRSRQPLEYANVVLFSMRDSAMVTGTVSDSAGRFEMRNVPFGSYYLVTNFIGYHRKNIKDINLTSENRILDLGQISLDMASVNIGEVTVAADKPHVEYKIDKKVVNVSQDILAAGGTAVDVLENVPSVSVDIEGNVSLRGSSSYTVLIDGKPSVISGSDALQQIPASTIDRIEIITNPSAKYDPDGVAGIINLILKEQKKEGLNGIINAGIASGNKYKADLLLNKRIKKVNYFGGLGCNYNEFTGTGESENRTFSSDTTLYRISSDERNMNRKRYEVKAGMDLDLTGTSSITLSGTAGIQGFGHDEVLQRHIYYSPAATDSYSRTISNSDRSGEYYSGSVDYLKKFDKPGQELSATAFYSWHNGDDKERQDDYETDAYGTLLTGNPETIRTTEGENETELRLKADYTMPILTSSKIETGYQSRLEYSKEDYIFSDYNYLINNWAENDLYTSIMDFRNNIHALYGLFSGEVKSFGYQLGLRGEYTDRYIKNQKSTEPYIIDQIDLFPTLHFSYKLPKDHEVLLSYTRRINRPRGWDLDPFVSYMDPYTLRAGNPGLKNEYVDSYEMGYQKRFGQSFFSVDAYYRVTSDKMTRITTLQEDGKMLYTIVNINNDYSLGTEFNLNIIPYKWLVLNAGVNLYRYRLEGTVTSEDVDTKSDNWDGRLNTTFKLKNDIRLQMMANYRGPSVTAQGKAEGFLMTNFAIRKDFLKKALAVTFSIRDIFKTARHEFTSSGEGFYSYNQFTREAPVFSIDLSYSINNYKAKPQEVDDSGSDSDSLQGY